MKTLNKQDFCEVVTQRGEDYVFDEEFDSAILQAFKMRANQFKIVQFDIVLLLGWQANFIARFIPPEEPESFSWLKYSNVHPGFENIIVWYNLKIGYLIDLDEFLDFYIANMDALEE